MDLKVWTPFPYLDREWRFDFPRFFRETDEFRPSMDVVRTNGTLVLTAELPGMTADDVDISLEGDVLTIKGEKTDEREVSDADRYVHERTFGSFHRRMTVPDGVTAKAIDAKFENGILTVQVTLPEVKEVEPKKIPVTAN
ncbi:MAG TPA: Hsp20/alpha crystallin family protein [Acidimicrobiia bacterium]